MKKYLFVLLSTVIACSSEKQATVSITSSSINSKALFQAISFVNEDTVWVSGHQASFARSIDGGKSWRALTHPSDTLQFRDLHAFDEDHVLLMSAGTGANSRIFHFYNSSGRWEEAYVMPHAEGFLNTIEFWDQDNGLAFGDALGEEYFILKTVDGGKTWNRVNPNILPSAGIGEGGFAASGTCVTTLPGGKAWIGTGAGGHSSILVTADYGETWSKSKSPMVTGDIAGIFSITMTDTDVGMIAGGDLNQPGVFTRNIAITNDAGKTWLFTSSAKTPGVFYGSDIYEGPPRLFVVAGPNGIDFSLDKGATWVQLDTAAYWAVDIYSSSRGLAVGPGGRIAKIEIN